MVVISIKKKDGDGFLFETTTDTPNSDLISSLVRIYNLRLQARAVSEAARGLALHGPMKKTPNYPQDSQSPTQPNVNQTIDIDDVIESNNSYSPDPSGLRNGKAPGPQFAKTLLQTIQDLEDYIDKQQVPKKIAMNETILEEKLSHVSGAIKMAYPMGLPDWDTVKTYLESTDSIPGILTSSNTALWVAGKEFQRDFFVRDRLGRNEKQKVIAKLVPISEGPPGREPVVSEEERKAMMAHYFKRQEELKKLSEADDDEYLNSAWSDPKEMKRGIHMQKKCVAPGIRF